MKLSVWISAFNHEKYIEQCLKSVLMQKTNFKFEIIIGEDCSTDNTRKIISDFKAKYPNRFRLFLPEKNIGMMAMDIATWKLCSGEYIALLNGDDYWTDENKLQTQVDFLEEHSDTVMCFHRARIEDETSGTSYETVFLEDEDILPVKSLLKGYNPVMTPTVVFKRVIEVPEWFADVPYGDMPLYLLLAEKGKIRYIDRTMAVYRIHPKGQWQGEKLKNNLKKDLRFYGMINEKLDYKYSRQIRKIIAHRLMDMTICCIKLKRIREAKNYFKKLCITNQNFIKDNSDIVTGIYRLLYDPALASRYEGLLKREVVWKID